MQSPSTVILEPKKIKSLIVFTVSPSICHEVIGPDAMILVYWMLSFKLTFSLSSFTFIKRLFSSLLFAVRVMSFAYLSNWYFSLQSWFQLVLHPVPWTARSNQSILKKIIPEYSLEGLLLKLKLQYFDHLICRANSLEKTLVLEKIEGRKKEKGTTEDEMVGWHHQLNRHEFEQALGVSEGQGSLACCSPWGCKQLDITTEQQQQNK